MTARQAQAPGVGKNAKRHDLEEPQPRLHDTDLQQGEVGEVNAGLGVVPIRPQGGSRPATAGDQQQQAARPAPAMDRPDAMEFIGERLKGTISTQPGISRPARGVDPSAFMPIIQALARAPGSGGVVSSAFVQQMRLLRNSPRGGVAVLDMNAADDALEELLDNQGF